MITPPSDIARFLSINYKHERGRFHSQPGTLFLCVFFVCICGLCDHFKEIKCGTCQPNFHKHQKLLCVNCCAYIYDYRPYHLYSNDYDRTVRVINIIFPITIPLFSKIMSIYACRSHSLITMIFLYRQCLKPTKYNSVQFAPCLVIQLALECLYDTQLSGFYWFLPKLIMFKQVSNAHYL